VRDSERGALRAREYLWGGKLHDCDGKEIPVVESAHGAVDPRPVLAKNSEHV